MVSAQDTRPHSRSGRLRTGLRLIPLLCAAWAGNAAAVDVIFQGPPGSSGLTGAAPGAAGGNGLAAPTALQVLFVNAPANTLTVTGGKGGDGGNGAAGAVNVTGGNAGAGGNGAATFADLTATLLAGPGTVTVVGTGGLGGNAGQPGAAGAGPAPGLGAAGGHGGAIVSNATLFTAGSAFSQVAATATGGQGGIGSAGFASGDGGAATSNARANSSGSAPLSLSSNATGGAGGAATAENAQAGAGGAATATNGLGAAASGVLDLTLLTTATGGRGGDANLDFTGAPHANGGNGGAATASHSAAYAGNSLSLSQTATGGAGGATIFGFGGQGGNATSTISLSSGAALSVDVAGRATGGQGGGGVGSPFEGPEYGRPGAGGSANSQLWLSSSASGWNAQITGTSTAVAGPKGEGSFTAPDGGSADAVSIVQGGGRVTSVADATGEYGANSGGYGVAQAVAGSNYIAVARANATGGGAFFNAGAGAGATAVASSGYFASADAVATAGSGRLGWRGGASATADAIVTRIAGDTAPALPAQPSEARAHAVSGAMGSVVAARSTYTDYGRNAAVTTRAGNGTSPSQYAPEATTLANVGGAAHGPWEPQDGAPAVVSYASALPTTASVAPLIASSAEVAAAFADATTLAAGTMAGMLFPLTASAELSLPFSAGDHLLLGLVMPFFSPTLDSTFSFSVSNGGASLYSGSFTTLAQADAVFNGQVLDLGVINANTLDLLLTFTLDSGIYGFTYLVGQGGALAPVPEPGTWILLLLGLALLAWRAGAFKATRFDHPHRHPRGMGGV